MMMSGPEPTCAASAAFGVTSFQVSDWMVTGTPVAAVNFFVFSSQIGLVALDERRPAQQLQRRALLRLERRGVRGGRERGEAARQRSRTDPGGGQSQKSAAIRMAHGRPLKAGRC